ncbi:hypothetical protein L6E12_27195 [Actinokineospora sp. PR83]|uniref:hypothetical protein n=1 Tax=Actinokineospora sp. PR83 TaxID=2884908 RepID=UPI001F2DECE3|nr:hypothetical protein [Actinokineospora sp. PR83]MCG8919465.1 hypothetical protein [Actinokineospora sp. PR83]
MTSFGPGGFGPAGSGVGITGTTPVPVRQDAAEADPGPAVETRRSRPAYLVEGDDDEMFGNADFTAPPVIGE